MVILRDPRYLVVILIGVSGAGKTALEEVKKCYIVKVLGDTAGNISRAAEILDFDRRSLYPMMERYQIASPRKKS